MRELAPECLDQSMHERCRTLGYELKCPLRQNAKDLNIVSRLAPRTKGA